LKERKENEPAVNAEMDEKTPPPGVPPPSESVAELDGLKLKEFLTELGKTDVIEFEYENKDTHIVIKKEPLGRIMGDEIEEKPQSAIESPPPPPPPKPEAKTKILKSPAVGAFYLVENDKPIVSVGDVTKKGKKLGWVDSMGIPQEIFAPSDCRIISILTSDSSAVEWGQELFEIEEI